MHTSTLGSLASPTETQDQVQGALLLDVVVGESPSVLELLTGEDKPLLVRRDALLVLDLSLDVLDGVGGLDLKGDGLSGHCAWFRAKTSQSRASDEARESGKRTRATRSTSRLLLDSSLTCLDENLHDWSSLAFLSLVSLFAQRRLSVRLDRVLVLLCSLFSLRRRSFGVPLLFVREDLSQFAPKRMPRL